MCDHGEDVSAFYSALPRLVFWLFRAPLWLCEMFFAVTLLLALDSKPPLALPISIFCLLSAPDCDWLTFLASTLLLAPPIKPACALPMPIDWLFNAPL